MVTGIKLIAEPRCTQGQRIASAALVDHVQLAQRDVKTWRLS